jgi:hypothetical protein
MYSRDFATRRLVTIPPERSGISATHTLNVTGQCATDVGPSDCMTIHRLIQNLAFNQDDIERLAAAYEEALLALHISDRDDPINKVIAQRIIEGARAGVRDPIALCKMAVKDLMVP